MFKGEQYMLGKHIFHAHIIMLGLALVSTPELLTRAKKQKVSSSVSKDVREIQSVEEFNKILKTNKQPKVLKFFSPSCGHCITMKPIVERVAEQHPNVLFLELSAKNSQVDSLFDTYKVNAYPTFVFLNASGKVVDTHEGGYSEPELNKEVSSLEKKA